MDAFKIEKAAVTNANNYLFIERLRETFMDIQWLFTKYCIYELLKCQKTCIILPYSICNGFRLQFHFKNLPFLFYYLNNNSQLLWWLLCVCVYLTRIYFLCVFISSQPPPPSADNLFVILFNRNACWDYYSLSVCFNSFNVQPFIHFQI